MEASDQELPGFPSPCRGFHGCPGQMELFSSSAEKSVNRDSSFSCLPSFPGKGHRRTVSRQAWKPGTPRPAAGSFSYFACRSMASSRDISSILRKPLTARFRISAVKQVVHAHPPDEAEEARSVACRGAEGDHRFSRGILPPADPGEGIVQERRQGAAPEKDVPSGRKGIADGRFRLSTMPLGQV